MQDPTITCPNCGSSIHLTESLAAPLIRAREAQLEKQALEKARKTVDLDLAARARETAELKSLLESREKKLAEAQAAQADLIRKQRELDDAKREFALTVEKRVQTELKTLREAARTEAEQALGLKLQEKDEQLASMQRQIEALRRKAEQGSQQLQGEAQELALEALLRQKFPGDLIEPVPKGEIGADLLHRVIGPAGQLCGTLLWEAKRTKNWSDTWLPKLRADQRTARADLALLVSQALPKNLQNFDLVEGIWVIDPRCALAVAVALRQSLIELTTARAATEGRQGKMERTYEYLTSPRFRQRIEAIVEHFTAMQSDLDRERLLMQKSWAKRESQIRGVLEATVGMYGDLQGIAGKSLPEIEGLALPMLEAPAAE